MKKKILMVSILTILLVAVLLVINRTSAQSAILELSITSWSIDCTSATGIDIWSIIAVWTNRTLSGNVWLGDNFGCADLSGNTWWNYTISSTDFVGTPSWSIPRDNISITPSGGITVTEWFCPSVTTGAGWILNTAQTLITKNNGYWQTCTFYLPSIQVRVSVDIPEWTPVGSYSSTFTIIYPS